MPEAEAMETEQIDAELEERLELDRSEASLEARLETQRKRKSTDNGVVVVAFYIDKETGKAYLKFEQKPANHSDEKVRGLLQPIGGHVDEGESPLEALAREIGEEIEEPGSSILKKRLMETQEKYATITDVINGKVVSTDIYVVEIKSASEGKNVMGSGHKHDAGPARTLDHITAYSLDNRYYAYGLGPVIKSIIVEYILPKTNPYKAFIYSDSINLSYPESVVINPIPKPIVKATNN